MVMPVPSKRSGFPAVFTRAMLCYSALLAMTRCLSVCLCLSFTSQCSVDTYGRIEMVFGTVLLENSGIYKIVILLFGTVFQTLNLGKKFARHADRRNMLSTRLDKGGHSVDIYRRRLTACLSH